MERPQGTIPIISNIPDFSASCRDYLWHGDVDNYLNLLDPNVKFDLVVTSPPYNIGKEYEERTKLDEYIAWQRTIISKIIPHVQETGHICWQVGNYIENGSIWPIDLEIAPIFRELGLHLRNRIIWHFGHGLHAQKRFSGRYEVILWFSKTDEYVFNLDPVRVPSKYPGKKHFKGPKVGQYSSNPLGKNPEDFWDVPPEDVWDIPNVKSNHIEKTGHPCQFPVGLIERLILSLTNEGDCVFDPFAGVGSAGVAAILHNRHFCGCDIVEDYLKIGQDRIDQAFRGNAKYRPYDKPIYDHTKSKLSHKPDEI